MERSRMAVFLLSHTVLVLHSAERASSAFCLKAVFRGGAMSFLGRGGRGRAAVEEDDDGDDDDGL
jgi:hypothetical protein